MYDDGFISITAHATTQGENDGILRHLEIVKTNEQKQRKKSSNQYCLVGSA